MRGLFSFVIGILIWAGDSAAGQVTNVQYVCNIEGERGILRAQLETIGGTGIVEGIDGDIGVIGGQGSNTWVTGELRTNSAYYTFSGENQFADFLDQQTGARFRVQWVPQRGGLIIVVNPFGDPVEYYCQNAG